MCLTYVSEACPISKIIKKLSAAQLRKEHKKTLATPRMKYGLSVRLMVALLDITYGRKAYVRKFELLELIARIPYLEWEDGTYRHMTNRYFDVRESKDLIALMQDAREQQDNEMYHLLILEEYIQRKHIHKDFLRFKVAPRLIVRGYRLFTWLLYRLSPKSSYMLNAYLEDHAEHEYAIFVKDHPELEKEPFKTAFAKEYGHHKTMGDLFRQISFDERIHKEDSLRLHKHSTKKHPKKQVD